MMQRPTLEPQPEQIPLPIACQQCGATDDLVTAWERVYSQRYREVTRCRLRPACWARTDARQGVA